MKNTTNLFIIRNNHNLLSSFVNMWQPILEARAFNGNLLTARFVQNYMFSDLKDLEILKDTDGLSRPGNWVVNIGFTHEFPVLEIPETIQKIGKVCAHLLTTGVCFNFFVLHGAIKTYDDFDFVFADGKWIKNNYLDVNISPEEVQRAHLTSNLITHSQG